MFVLMVVEPSPVLSDHPPDLARRAGLGDRFHYFCGRSGRRYLFSAVGRRDLVDFRSAVIILAGRTPAGRLAALAITTLDAAGEPVGGWRHWLPAAPPDWVVLVHLLASNEAARRAIVDDLDTASSPLASTERRRQPRERRVADAEVIQVAGRVDDVARVVA
ncbi:MAG: hypothetical protein WD036_11880 [Bauldia sp.]